MNKILLRLVVLTSLTLPLAACFGPGTPQEVTQAFWEAVFDNDTGDIVDYSTLTGPEYYDGFLSDWAGYQSSFGKVTIEDKVASIDTELYGPANSSQSNRRFTTYLVLRDKAWKVDYDRTKLSIRGGPIGELFEKLNKAGGDLSRQIESSADAFRLEMERLGKELEQKSESMGQQASESIEKYAEQLRNSLQELEESINRALENEDNNLTDKDKRQLREISADLDEDSESLSGSGAGVVTARVVTESGKNLGVNQQRLEAIDNESLNEYRKEWLDLGRQYEEIMRHMMDELSPNTEHDDAT